MRYFLLLARYVPNVTRRSIWNQCNNWGPTDDRRPTSVHGRAFLEEIQMAISQQPIIRSTSGLILEWGCRGRPI